MGDIGRDREVLFEFRQAGPQMRVAAIDVETGIEVVAIAPLTATEMQMKTLALGKLRRRIEMEAGRGA